MGYGHLRAAHALAHACGGQVLHADEPPLADDEEQAAWRRIRGVYEGISRVSTASFVGKPFRALLDAATAIPHLYPMRDMSAPTLGVRMLRYSAQRGLGRSLVSYLEQHQLPLITTFFTPALLADFHGYDRVFSVVTDADINRIWAPFEPARSKIVYMAPSGRVVRRLRAYGVAPDRIELTGFPLPHTLLGGQDLEALKRNLRSRLVRLDVGAVFRRQYAAELAALGDLPDEPGPPHLVFAIGGAGAQAELAGRFLPSLRPLLQAGRLRLTLVAGRKVEVHALFERQLEEAGLSRELGRSIDILFEPSTTRYFERFERLMADCDILWTKPSELTFYGALGIALVLAPPVGVHEHYNRRWARENGAGLKQRDPEAAGEWLADWLKDGTLAAAAWAGHRRLPCRGLYKILARVGYAVEDAGE